MQNESQGLLRETWRKLLKNKLAFFGISIIAVFALIAILGALIRPDKTPDANDQILEISRKKPGFSVSMLEVELNKEIQKVSPLKLLFFGGQNLSYQNIPIEKYSIKNDSVIAVLYSEVSTDRLRREYHIADVLYALDISKPMERIGDQFSFTLVNGEVITTDLTSMVNEIPNRIHPQYFVFRNR